MKATNTLSSFSYLLIGSGRVARHLSHYLSLLNIHFESWDRAQDPHALSVKVSKASHVLLAISDNALENFYHKNLEGHNKTVVHFSGAKHFEGMISAHPLMTFGPELYELSLYKKIHFTLTGTENLAMALPGLENSFSEIAAAQKPLYHSLCVLGGNFVTLLTAKMTEDLKSLGVPASATHLYSEQILKNTLEHSQAALTGPLIRKDADTVAANLAALEGDPYQTVYQSFLKIHWPDYPRK